MKKLLLISIFLFSSLSLSASPVDETLGGTNSINPLSARMFGESSASTYFNPALLPKIKRGFSLNFFYSRQNLDVSLLERDPSLDIIGDVSKGTGIYGADREGVPLRGTHFPFKTRPTADLGERGGVSPNQGSWYGSLGLVLPLWKDYLALGFHGLIPLGSLMKESSFFVDEREANFSNSLHYELYDDRMSSFNLSLALAGGYKWVYFGAGVKVTAKALVNALIFTPDAGKNENKISTNAKINPLLTPYFGLIIRPWGPIQLGLTAHLPVKTDIDVNTIITFWNIDREKEAEINKNSVFVAYAYLPLTFSPSIALVDYKFNNDLVLNLGFTAIWRQWSKYLNRYNEHPEYNVYWDDSIEIKDKNGNITNVGGWAVENLNKYKWKDSWEFVLGVNFKYKEIKTGLDLAYFDSPVPEQKGRTNYVDNDKITVGAGFSYTWDLPEKFQLELGGNFQAQMMIKKKTVKDEGVANSVGKNGEVVDEFPDSVCDGFSDDCPAGSRIVESEGFQTNNPGYPGYVSSGQILSGGIWLTLYF